MNNLDIEKLKLYINDLEEQMTPLTKKSKPKQLEEPAITDIPTQQQEEVEEKPKKPKKPYSVTDKKLIALEMAREKKNENHAKRVQQKKLESAKLLLAEELGKPKAPEPTPKPTQRKKIVEVEQESETEVIYVKKPKKNKKIIVEESSSSESEESVHEPKKLKDFGKSHKNKKSVVKVHQSNPPTQQRTFTNYFCD